jgi:hypothetical protein
MAPREPHWSKTQDKWKWVGRLPWRSKARSEDILDVDALKLWMREMEKWGTHMAQKLKDTTDRLDAAEQQLRRHHH